ncbi:MAG: MerR family transcriptional regulator [Treponemataceae bacterium]|nr:MerR family transcriptional regulator [Treponemataceae bacterium]
MASYSIGEVEKLTGIKAHTLRYWEENVAFLSPKKDGFGRRIYSKKDVELILRLKFLISQQGFSIEKAAEQILAEKTDNSKLQVQQELSTIKEELLELYKIYLQQQKTGAANKGSVQIPQNNGQQNDR